MLKVAIAWQRAGKAGKGDEQYGTFFSQPFKEDDDNGSDDSNEG